MELSLPGAGEAPISITSSPSRPGFLEFTIRAVGRVTKAIHNLSISDTLYLRGPYGNNMVLDRRADFKNIKILYGARTPDELCFKREISEWQKKSQIEVLLTVDAPCKDWVGHVGVVTTLWDKTDISPRDAIAYVCGPPVMIRFVVQKLQESGFKNEDIYVSLERYMKCGIGKCGHCNIAGKLVCIDGPVFSLNQIREFPDKEYAI